MATIQDLMKAYEPMGLEVFDEDEEERFEKIKMYAAFLVLGFAYMPTVISLKARGKGAPKKKRTAEGMCGDSCASLSMC
jgi:small subunit ribosomal protein S33